MSDKVTRVHGQGSEGETAPRYNRWRVLLSMLAVVLAIVTIVAFVMVRKPPARTEAEEETAPPVQVHRLVADDVQIVVQGHGTVQPKVTMEIVPEVAGKVMFVHSEFEVGGIIRANEPIVQIDPRDYELGVRQAQATVAEVQARLDTEIAEAQVERREWHQPDLDARSDPLRMLREPRIRRAKAALESADAQLAMAELKLERTKISLPFDAMIAGSMVDLGQYVQVGQCLAIAHGIDAFEIEVLLEGEDLAWLDGLRAPGVVGARSDETIAPAQARAEFAGVRHTWDGYVTRMAGRVDSASRKVPVVVEVAKPLEAGKPPLLPGAVVEVLIAGEILNQAVAVPLAAVRDGNCVWLVEDGRLTFRPVEFVWTDSRHAYAVSGLSDGALVVTGPLDGVAEGTVVRISEDVDGGNS